MPHEISAAIGAAHSTSRGNAVMTAGVRSTLKAALLGTVAALAVSGAAMADRNDDQGKGRGAHHRWYVSASAAAGGDGSAHAPFNSLALVQAASGPGDTIVVLPSPLSAPPLDGGIALKPGQRLIGDGPTVVRV